MTKVPGLRLGIAAAVLLTAAGVPAAGQRVPANYTVITLRKVAPEKVDAFLAFSKGQMKKLAQARIDSGGIRYWALLKLTTPYAAGSDYNYATVTSSDKFPDLDPATAEMDALFGKVGLSRTEYGRTLRELSTMVRQEITRTALRVGSPVEAGNYIRVDYHQAPADRPGELFEMEETVYAPMFQAVTSAGKGIRAWTVAFPVLPTMGETGYNLYTTQVFKDSQSLGAGAGTTQEVFKQVHPNRNYMNTIQHTRSIDKIVRVRVYHVLDVLGAPIAATAPSN